MKDFETSTHKFVVAIENKNIADMKHVMNEYITMGYTKVQTFEHEGNTILIYAKEK